jgi:hypothetical protein
MKLIFVFNVCVFLMLSRILPAQSAYSNYIFRNNSLDINTSAQSIGGGEASVANNFFYSNLFANPAALLSNHRIQIAYNERNFNWNELYKNAKYQSISVQFNSSAGAFTLAYNKFSSGEITFSSPFYNESYTDANTTFIAGYSRQIISGLSFGINAKIFSRSKTSSLGYNSELESNNAVLFDAGLVYSFKYFFADNDFKDRLNIGASIQNFGTDFKQNDHSLDNIYRIVKLPRYFRAGFAYQLQMILGQRTRANVDLVFSGEYKNLLNALDSEKSNRDCWNVGLESKLLNTVYFRIGAVNSPENNLLFDRKKWNMRYGAGIRMPYLASLFRLPIEVEFNFSLISINKIAMANSEGKDNLTAFGISLSLMDDLFR